MTDEWEASKGIVQGFMYSTTSTVLLQQVQVVQDLVLYKHCTSTSTVLVIVQLPRTLSHLS
jgi:hypothetical protein